MSQHEPLIIDLSGRNGSPATATDDPTPGVPGRLLVVRLTVVNGEVVLRINEGREYRWYADQDLHLQVSGGDGQPGRAGQPGQAGHAGNKGRIMSCFGRDIVEDGENGAPGEMGGNGENGSDGAHAGDILVVIKSTDYPILMERFKAGRVSLQLGGGRPGPGGNGGPGGKGGAGGTCLLGPNAYGQVAQPGQRGPDGPSGVAGMPGKAGFAGTFSIFLEDTLRHIPVEV